MSTSPLFKGHQLTVVTATTVQKHNPTMEDFKFRDGLPTAEELPDSDDQPVDSELQELIPGLLKAILFDQWQNRTDWLFGIDLGLYYDPDLPCIAPDGFLSLGVKDAVDENLRPSYVLWDEKVIPLFALEIVSKAYRQEHSKKLAIYQSIGILYYAVYAPLRKRKAKFQLYKLIDGEYVLQGAGEQSYWMPELGLGIAPELGTYGGRQREWLYWYDQNGWRYPTPTERAESESQRADAESAARQIAEQRAAFLLERLRELGVDPKAIFDDPVEPTN
jgi:Uma2 family endonuclease